jgi:carboxyl-terminal processing protease
VSVAWGTSLLACAGAPVPPPSAEDPVIAQAREVLATRHPEGARVSGVTAARGASRAAGIEALLAALGDPSTRLLGPDAWAAFLAEVSGAATVGVGLRELLDLDLGRDGRLVVITTQPGGPAARGGLAPGDVLETVDGQPVGTLGEAMARLRGREGSDVRLGLRHGGEARSVTLRREALRADGSHVRAGRTEGGALHLALDGFSAGTPAAVERALQDAGDGPVVLDLRNNPGGALDAALAVAGLFLGEREVMRTVGKLDAPVLRSVGTSRVQGRVVVVTNAGTASAAELLAAALRDSGRARLVGESTAGKALVHAPAELDDGSVLLISVGRLVRMDGKEILGRGLEPDERVSWDRSIHPPLPVPGHPASDAQLAAALAALRR